jgi:hypothetical protein
MSNPLTEQERRVLGHLPVWAEDEAAFIQAELDGGAAESIRSHTVLELVARLVADKASPARSEEQVAMTLDHLHEAGLVAEADGQWRMTEAGLTALTEPWLAEHEQTPGPVQIGTGG